MYISGRTFQVWRTNAGYTRTKFAREVRCSHSLVSRVENGERGLSPDMLGRWLAFYGVDKLDVQFKKEVS